MTTRHSQCMIHLQQSADQKVTTCPVVLRLRKQVPSLLLSQQTRLIAHSLRCNEPVQLDRWESIALAACLRFWKERKHSFPSPNTEALGLVTSEGMRRIHNQTLRKERATELASIARQLSVSTYAQSYYPNSPEPQLLK